MHLFPDLVRLEKKYPKQLVVLGVHSPKFQSEKNSENIRKAMQRYEIRHPVVNDADRKIWQTYGVQSWPTAVLIDPEGYVVSVLPDEHIFGSFDKLITQLVRVHRAKKTLNEGPAAFQELRVADSKSNPLFFPGKVTADADGKRLFIADSTHHRIVITDLDGKKIAVAGTGVEGKADGPFDKAMFADPQGMALQGETLYVADRKNHLIRALDLKMKTVKTVAGTGQQGRDLRRGGAALRVGLNSPWDLLLLGNYLFIAMAGHHQIWAMDLTKHTLTPFAGNGFENIVDGPRNACCFAQPSGLATDGNWLYVADSEVSAIRAIALGGLGAVQTIVGAGLFEFGDNDGVGADVRLQHALGIVFHDNKLYIADTYNSKIKEINPAKRSCVTLVDGASAGGAEPLFNEPGGLSYADGKLYVADTNSHRIQVVDLTTKKVSTLKLQGVDPPGNEKSK